ncbi:MAG: hypothetical protein WBS20_10200 [Lysobacterales bacterium]
MNFLRLLPVIFSFLLIAAHFYRAGQVVSAFLLLSLLLLLMVRNAWVPRVMQLVLVLAAVEWLRTLFTIAQLRIEMGAPWGRMAVILGMVALFTALSGLVFRTAALRSRFSDGKHAGVE